MSSHPALKKLNFDMQLIIQQLVRKVITLFRSKSGVGVGVSVGGGGGGDKIVSPSIGAISMSDHESSHTSPTITSVGKRKSLHTNSNDTNQADAQIGSNKRVSNARTQERPKRHKPSKIIKSAPNDGHISDNISSNCIADINDGNSQTDDSKVVE
jgi:hypothetical protein